MQTPIALSTVTTHRGFAVRNKFSWVLVPKTSQHPPLSPRAALMSGQKGEIHWF